MGAFGVATLVPWGPTAMKRKSPLETAERSTLDRIATRNLEMHRLIEYARQVAASPYPVLIEGETGTGKELFARGIHEASGRPGAFVAVNCGAIPENLFEAEIFGARRGAYTGLEDDRPGLFQAADHGTLFLDEVADLPVATQAKLLRVLNDGEFRRLGDVRPLKADARIIAATHKNLAQLVEEGLFRRDLYYRLSAACLRVPPLRERKEDIPVLVRAAVAEAACVLGEEPRKVEAQVMALLMEYPWPGNVRELFHAVARAVLYGRGPTLGALDVAFLRDAETGEGGDAGDTPPPFFDALEKFERSYVSDLWQRAGGNISVASRLSGLSRAAVRTKARAHRLVDWSGPAPQKKRSRVRLPG